jgi:L-aminopeptidase/D-esterase-like protein
MADWSELKEKVLSDCVKRLDSLGLQYAIIRTNGEKIGSLDVTQPQEKKRGPNRYGPNELRNYIAPVLTDMNVGDEANIPCGKFDVKALHSSITAFASGIWGNGSYASSRSKDNDSILILRVA